MPRAPEGPRDCSRGAHLPWGRGCKGEVCLSGSFPDAIPKASDNEAEGETNSAVSWDPNTKQVSVHPSDIRGRWRVRGVLTGASPLSSPSQPGSLTQSLNPFRDATAAQRSPARGRRLHTPRVRLAPFHHGAAPGLYETKLAPSVSTPGKCNHATSLGPGLFNMHTPDR